MTPSDASTDRGILRLGLPLAGLLAAWGLAAACGGSGTGDTTNGQQPQLGTCTDADPFTCEADTPTWAATLDSRSIDGKGNNIANLEWGAAQQPVRRTTFNAYGDGKSTPAREDAGSARLISSIVCTQPILANGTENIPNARGGSDYMWQWGQFVDHDMSFTTLNAAVPESMNIPIPQGDPYFDPSSYGTKTMTFLRSNYVAGSVPRQQININTSFIDASNVYGSDPAREAELRANDGTGRLITSPGNLLPFNTTLLNNASPNNPNQSGLFMCGDIRCNEQVGLTSMQELFLREHNRIAGLLHTEQPQLSDEQVFQLARAVVGAESEHITYDTYLPILLGPNAIPAYSGYNPDVDPTVENMFTILFRVGHSMLDSNLQMIGPNLASIASGPMSMMNAFFNPEFMIVGAGLEPVLRGLAMQHSQEIDLFLVPEVQDFLFNTAASPGDNGLDLAALNIQRGRDHGLGSYTQTEHDYGLPVAGSMEDVTSDTTLQGKLTGAYQGNVNEIDPWVGALAEDHVPGAMVGPLLVAVLKEQFIRTRDGDRYWYEAVLPADLVSWVKTQTLAKIIRRNTTIGDELPDNVFLVPQP